MLPIVQSVEIAESCNFRWESSRELIGIQVAVEAIHHNQQLVRNRPN